MAFLASHPEIKQRLRANIHMDMVGGDPFKNKSIFHVTGTPWSLPSFVTDVGALFLTTIKTAASDYSAGGGSPDDGIVETRAGTQGTHNELIADVTPYAEGSDHNVYDSSTVAVPSLYLRDWPDIYIHTDHDSVAQIDPTKLRRVALLGAASGYVYASLDSKLLPQALPYLAAQSNARLSADFSRAQQLFNDPNLDGSKLDAAAAWYEARNLMNHALLREQTVRASFNALAGGTSAPVETQALSPTVNGYNTWIDQQARSRGAKEKTPVAPWAAEADARRIPVRTGEFGPLSYQNDNVLQARLGKDRYAKIKLLNAESTHLLTFQTLSDLYAYEIVNFVNGKNSAGEIRDAVSAEFGPIPIAVVVDYLNACVEAKVVQWK